MRLLFDLSPADKAAFEAASAGERILYCLPFDCRGGQRVDGRMVFTDKAIYKVIDAEVEARWDFSELSDFSVEVLYGCGAFFAKVNGNTTRLCRFISGRNLTRYSIMVEACNRIVEGDTVNTVVSDAPERYCPKCGRPFIVNTHICPYCQSKRELESIPAVLSEGKSMGFHRELCENEILMTSDTLVLCGERVMGKPHSREEAIDMIKTLSGRSHKVITAVTVRDCSRMKTMSDTAHVHFKNLTDSQIEYYIDNYRPYDKAGAYGIQEWIGYIGIDRIEGSYFTIMGLPVHLAYELLTEFIG